MLHRSWRAPAVLAMVLPSLLSQAAEARAERWSLASAAAVLLGYSNNGSSAGATAAQTAYYQVRPSLLVTVAAPRATHETRLAAELVDTWSDHFELETTAGATLSHRSAFTIAPTKDLSAGMGLGVGRIRTGIGQAGEAMPEAVPEAMPEAKIGDARFVRASLSQSIRWQWSRNVTLHQQSSGQWLSVTPAQIGNMIGNVTGNRPITTTTQIVALTAGAERSWTRTTAGVLASSDYLRAASSGQAQNQQLTAHIAAHLRRELSPRWTAYASAGGSMLATLTATERLAATRVTYTFKLGANYVRPFGPDNITAGLSAHHDYTPNPFMGTITESTGAALTAAVPIIRFSGGRESRVEVRTSVSGTYSTLTGALSQDTPAWHRATADLAMAWTVRNGVELALRYQVVRQKLAISGTAMTPIALPADLARDTVMLQVTGRWTNDARRRQR